MTTRTRTGRKHRSAPVFGLKAVGDEAPGVFEAIVSVFGNVDYGNDRVMAGAFSKSLERWAASGDPIPVVFSHRWDELDAHVGEVLEAKELLPGDAALPPELAENGGLWVKFSLDVDEDDDPAARKVARLLSKRRIREFSFAYDVIEEKTGNDGATELLELDVIEVGPTLKGMNPATVLMARARKALGDGVTDEELVERVVAALDPDASKAWVSIGGSIEERLEAVYAAAVGWAREGDVGAGGFYAAYLEATFEDRVLVLVEGWDDPVGEGIYFELAYSIDDDGEVELGEARAVELEVELVAKSRAMKHRIRPGSATATKERRTVARGKSEGQGDELPEEPEDEDQHDETEDEEDLPPADPSLVDLELAEIELGTSTTDDPEEGTSDEDEDGARGGEAGEGQ